MMEHEYAGAGQMAEPVKNTFGWSVTPASAVGHGVWEDIFEAYVQDRYALGLEAFFEKHNPHARQEVLASLLEAARKDYWDPTDAQREAIARAYAESVARHGPSAGLVSGGNDALDDTVRRQLDAPGDEPLAARFNAAVEAPRSDGCSESSAPRACWCCSAPGGAAGVCDDVRRGPTGVAHAHDRAAPTRHRAARGGGGGDAGLRRRAVRERVATASGAAGLQGVARGADPRSRARPPGDGPAGGLWIPARPVRPRPPDPDGGSEGHRRPAPARGAQPRAPEPRRTPRPDARPRRPPHPHRPRPRRAVHRGRADSWSPSSPTSASPSCCSGRR